MTENQPAIGTTYQSREAMAAVGVHTHFRAGIDYESKGNAKAIVLNGGYKDDVDLGDRVIYTGQGGQSKTGPKRQIEDQQLVRGNGALVNSHMNGSPIMVFRGAGGDKQFSPTKGYRYDGLYLVTKHWFEPSIDGPLVIRFELNRLENQEIGTESDLTSQIGTAPIGNSSPARASIKSGTRIKRDPEIPKWIKNLYQDECQICGITVKTPTGSYSQGAHIRGLGEPHNGTDTVSNMLCLCPNCHVMFDFGTYYIKDDGISVVNILTAETRNLKILEPHQLDMTAIGHHRLHVAGVH